MVEEKNRLIKLYRGATSYAEDLRTLRDEITNQKKDAIDTLNEILLSEFQQLKIKYEQATWDEKKKSEGKPVKRSLKIEDIEALKPFHWGFEFDEILNRLGGFDAIITNPPWEIFKPNAKEFFKEFSDLVTKKKMTIKDFENEKSQILKDHDVRNAWLEYLGSYPHLSIFYRTAKQYRNQISEIDGKKAGTDINFYKLFAEQCFNLLRKGGYCGIVIPSGIYTDLGTKQLREMLFTQNKITGLFCFENRKNIFENVDTRFKFLVLTFEKGQKTEYVPSAFMRHDVQELDRFPQEGAINISVDLIRKLSPDSISLMEFKNSSESVIASKLLNFSLLGDKIPNSWQFILKNEFHMRNDSHLFKTESGKNRLPLFTGKMFHQFCLTKEHSGYWIEEKDGRKSLLGKENDFGQVLDYQRYRWVHRRIASNTNERTLITSITPKMVFTEVNSTTIEVRKSGINSQEMIFLCAMCNSFILDWLIRLKITTTLNMFYLYQLPLPRLGKKDPPFWPIVNRAAMLICTTPEFDDLGQEVGMKSHREGATDLVERGRLRAELDGLIAHLYGLTEEEFAYILTTFPLVPDPVKIAAHNAFRNVEKGLIK